MPKIKGRAYKRVARKADGTCPKGAKKYRRSGNKKFSCYVPVAGKKRGKKKKR